MRRAIPFLIVGATLILSACSDLSSPRRDDPNSDGNGGCKSGYTLGSGHTCEPVGG